MTAAPARASGWRLSRDLAAGTAATWSPDRRPWVPCSGSRCPCTRRSGRCTRPGTGDLAACPAAVGGVSAPVLVVDDHVLFAQSVALALESAGAAVQVVAPRRQPTSCVPHGRRADHRAAGPPLDPVGGGPTAQRARPGRAPRGGRLPGAGAHRRARRRGLGHRRGARRACRAPQGRRPRRAGHDRRAGAGRRGRPRPRTAARAGRGGRRAGTSARRGWAPFQQLSPREAEVLRLLAAGQAAAGIARAPT